MATSSLASSVGPVGPVGPYRVKEAECKFLSLHRGITLKIQELLSYVSVDPNFSCSDLQTKTSGEFLSEILQEHATFVGFENFKKHLPNIFWDDNSITFFTQKPSKHQILFKSEIDITQLDISVAIPILKTIPFFPPSTKGYRITTCNVNKIKHSDTLCKHDFICCGRCMQCIKCSHKCFLSNLQLEHVRMMRNKIHLTPQQFEEINDNLLENPQHKKSQEWNINIRELAESIKTICTYVSPSGTCYKDCKSCKSIDDVVNKNMQEYINLFFDNDTKLQEYRDQVLDTIVPEQLLCISEKVDETSIKIDAIYTKLTELISMCALDKVGVTYAVKESLLDAFPDVVLTENADHNDENCPSNSQKLTSIYLTAISDFKSSAKDLLSFKQNDQFEVIKKVTDEKLYVCNFTNNEEGYVLAKYMQDDDPLTFYDWYRPKIDKNGAESLLVRFGVPGTFLIRKKQVDRDSDEYTLSLRDIDAIKHYHIRSHPTKGYSISTKMIFADLPSLVCHYQHRSSGLCRKLKMFCPKENLSNGWEIKRNQIQVLGDGQVRKGVWNETIKVALKQFKVDKYEQEKFMNEFKIMQNLKNSRLVQLYGVCMEEERRWIVMELVPKGNLKKFLHNEGSDLTVADLLKMAEQVLEGLWYLEQNRVVHRDIGARNILVNTKDDLKISDFSLSRYLADKDVIIDKERDRKFPMKWTSPESLLYKQFSIKSDVWSFGILLFEIITKGKEPYAEMTPAETYEKVPFDGYRMPCPPECKNDVYKLMELCWLENPYERPGFEKLLWEVNDLQINKRERTLR